MNLSRAILITLVLAALVALHFTLRPLLDWRAGVDFLVIGILMVAVRVRPGTAAVVGLLLGAVVDAMTPEALGSGALAMTLMAFGASRLKAAFFADDLGINAVFVFLGKLSFDVVATLAEGRLRGMTLVWQLLAWTPLSALATAAAGVLVLAVVRPALEARRTR
ncbi:MAG: rod shape-determining protein MreD [Gemmatimonadaceae bacterium]|nr:rod shape-determining protein MreD [Gemmatimonadaceae bacterium]MCW5825296.1 rod shape-determining protein MreD [Gemmatimonadaceae bacterium]